MMAAKRSAETLVTGGSKMVKLNAGTPAPVAVSEKKVVKLQTSAPSAVSAHGVDVSSEALIDRSQRFVSATGSTTVSLKGAGAAPANHFAPKTQLGLGGARAGSIRGYSTDLERPYLRLHFAPDPATIRPPDVLEKALALVKKKWVTHHDFRHATEQLMAIQQDCKLQGVESTLTCDAYETLLRIALEQADLAEFTRCLTSLNELYHKADLVSEDWSAHKNEMMAYRMLFLMREDKDMLEKTSALLATFTPSQRADSDIAFACSVCTALLARDFAAFFRLYASAPKMSGYVLDFFVDRVRAQALSVFVKAYQPDIGLDALKAMLSFEKRKDCFRWLRAQGCVVSEDKRLVDTKATVAAKAPGGGARPPQTKNEPQEKRKPLSIDELLSAGKNNSGGKGGSAKTDKGLTFSSKGFQKKQKKKK